jgi:hypothetical protein
MDKKKAKYFSHKKESTVKILPNPNSEPMITYYKKIKGNSNYTPPKKKRKK